MTCRRRGYADLSDESTRGQSRTQNLPAEVWGTNIPIGLVGAPNAGRLREDRHGLSLKVAADEQRWRCRRRSSIWTANAG